AVVTFDVAPFDGLSGVETVVFTQGLPSGSTFPHGSTFENVTITDKAGNTTFRTFSVIVNKTLQSITVSPAPATINQCPGGQQCQAIGHFTDGSTQTLPSGTGGGRSNPGGPPWQVQFPSSLNTNACGAGGGFSSQGLSPQAGVVHTSWGSPAI